MTSPTLFRDPIDLVSLWAEGMTQVMGGGNGGSIPAWAVPKDASAGSSQSQSDLWILVALSGALRGEMALRIPATVELRVAQTFMGEVIDPQAQLTPEHNDALLELFRQTGGLAATAIKPLRGEVRFQVDLVTSSPSWPASSTAWLQWGADAPDSWIELRLSAGLVAAFRVEPAELPPPGSSDSAAPPETGDVKLDLLMDVELGVALRFGSRRLLLREVLDLNPGSVIALDRQVEEPVDMLLDGRIIARGEVVVVDGNYGFRVNELGPSA